MTTVFSRLGFLFLLTCSSIALAEPRLPNVYKGKVFVRLSPEAFSELQNRPIKHQGDVNDVILGTSVHGRCLTTGQASLKPNEKEQGLLLLVTGQCITTSTGVNGPATIHSTTTTDFVATAPIVYDDKLGFHAGAVHVDARSRVNTDGIDTMQGGLVGRIVRGVAERRVEEAKPMASEIARQKAIARIQATVNDELAVKLKQVNQSMSRLHEMVAILKPEMTKNGCFRAYKNQMLLYFQGDEVDEALFRELPELTATCELWIHQDVIDKDLQRQLSGLATVRDTAGAVVDSARKLLDPKVTTPVKADASVPAAVVADPWVREHGNWFVVRVPATVLKEATAVVGKAPPTAKPVSNTKAPSNP